MQSIRLYEPLVPSNHPLQNTAVLTIPFSWKVKRTWKERLFTRPWNPFKKWNVEPIVGDVYFTNVKRPEKEEVGVVPEEQQYMQDLLKRMKKYGKSFPSYKFMRGCVAICHPDKLADALAALKTGNGNYSLETTAVDTNAIKSKFAWLDSVHVGDLHPPKQLVCQTWEHYQLSEDAEELKECELLARYVRELGVVREENWLSEQEKALKKIEELLGWLGKEIKFYENQEVNIVDKKIDEQ